MIKIMHHIAKGIAILFLAMFLALIAYDVLAVRPHLARIRALLAQADPEDASPPEAIRRLIDANVGSLSPQAVRLVTSRVPSDLTQGQSQIRETLWRMLLPMHIDKSQMYGIYCSLSYNGVDQGLSSFANRAFGKPLSQLSPMQAATTVAITHAPTLYLRDRNRLAQRARTLLVRSQYPR
ncbi:MULTISPECIES: transglycosylase domain-containing protein [Xanthomonas]|uniref:transglycosylase domain-containing protein n=1 Tax=Xanthomonas TaxID=338 RepID=UPI001AD9A65A|nr:MULTISPECIES: transglycosylase domain-containing protein [unclassified Xanthomonas]MBO9873474.1 transglycosylase domain-containing protein [Xanthomonas sp. D-93]WNH45259.1 transglycosylase domain-containing protein [Xanthomonas sp. A6251]